MVNSSTIVITGLTTIIQPVTTIVGQMALITANRTPVSANETIFAPSMIQSFLKIRKRKHRNVRRFWVKPGRSKSWWHKLWTGKAPEDEWKLYLRLGRSTFMNLLAKISPDISLQTSTCRKPVPPEIQLAATLYYLSDAGRQRKTANAFGLSTSTVSIIVRRVCLASVKRIDNISLPKTDLEVKSLVDGFYAAHGFPQCIGAVDGTHVPIKRPTESYTAYINRKKFFSLNVQLTVGYQQRIIDSSIRWHGSVHDARVFVNSNINGAFQRGFIPRCPKEIVRGEPPVGIVILGDPAYPSLPYLLKEYVGGGVTPDQNFFGYRLSSARMVVECAIGKLKGRWRSLQNPLPIKADFVPILILACLKLHNFCIDSDDQLREAEIQVAIGVERTTQPPPVGLQGGLRPTVNAESVRKVFVKYFE